MSYSIKVNEDNFIRFTSDDRGPCDDYCPLVSATSCGLPEARDVYAAAKRGLVWACHSNKTLPCVSTSYSKFPEGCTIIKTSEEFMELTGYEC